MISAFYEDEKRGSKEREVSSMQAFKDLIPYLQEHTGRLVFCLLLLAGVIVFALAWPKLIQEAIDGPIVEQLQVPHGERDFSDLLWYGLAIFLIQIVSIVLQYYQYVKLEIIGQDIILSIKRRLFDHVLSLDISFFDTNPVGRLMSRIESDTESLRLLFTNTVVVVVGDLLLMAGIYTWMFIREWRLALVLFLFVPVLALMVWIFHKLTTHRFLEVRKRMAEITASLTELIQGGCLCQYRSLHLL